MTLRQPMRIRNHENEFNHQYRSKLTTNYLLLNHQFVDLFLSLPYTVLQVSTPASYELMAACNCSKLFPLVSGTATIINNIANALIAA